MAQVTMTDKEYNDLLALTGGNYATGQGNNQGNNNRGNNSGNNTGNGLGDPLYVSSGVDVNNIDGEAGTTTAEIPDAPPSSADPRAAMEGGTRPLSGFASRYSPVGAQQAFENPWYILRDVFPGMSVSSPGYQALRDFGADPLVLYNIMQGAMQSIEDQGGGDFINFMDELYRQLGSPGGRGFSALELINNIFGASNQVNEEGVGQTTLAQILGAGDQSTQIRTLFNLLRDVSNASMNPLAASAYQSAVAQAGDVYGNQMMQSGVEDTVGPAAWIAQNMPWLAGR